MKMETLGAVRRVFFYLFQMWKTLKHMIFQVNLKKKVVH